MAETPGGRRLDTVAVAAALRRLARAAEPPWLHGEVARRLDEHLAPIRIEPTRVLAWWAGAGGGEALLRTRYPRAELIAVEADSAWLERRPAARPWWSLGRDARGARRLAGSDDAALGPAQLVWANMVLHGIADPPALFARWHRLLEIGGLAAFSCLGPGTLRELREIYAAERWPAPTPGFVDMHDFGDMLVAAGFAEPVLDQETLSLRFASASAALRELRQLGGNAAPDRFAGLRTPRWRRRLERALAERAGSDGTIALSIEVAYGHGFKPAPRAAAGPPTAVSLEEMRALVRRGPAPR